MGEVFGGVSEVHRSPAAVVEGSRVDAGRLLEEVRPVLPGRKRHLLLELAVDVEHVARLADFQHGRFARDRDRLVECAERHRDVDLEVDGGPQQNPIALVGREPRQFRGDGVLARRQVDQAVVARRVGDAGGGCDHVGARRGDRDTRQDPALVILHVAAQAAARGLRLHDKRARHQDDEQEYPESRNPHGVFLPRYDDQRPVGPQSTS